MTGKRVSPAGGQRFHSGASGRFPILCGQHENLRWQDHCTLIRQDMRNYNIHLSEKRTEATDWVALHRAFL